MADETTTTTTAQPNGTATTQESNGTSTQPNGSTTAASTPSASASTDLGTEEQTSATDLGGTDDEAAAAAAEAAAKAAEPPKFFGLPKNEDGTEGDYAEFTLPEGSVANPELQDSFKGLAKELGLNQEGAQKLVDYKTQLDQANIKAWGNHLAELKTQAKTDPQIGGANYDLAVKAGRAVIAKFGGDANQQKELRAMMDHYGVGAHPAMIRFFANIGKATGETSTPGTGGQGGSVAKPLHEILYGDNP